MAKTYVKVELNLGEEGHPLRSQTERQVSGVVTGRSIDTSPVLDLRQNQRHELVDKVVGLTSLQRDLATRLVALPDTPLHNTVLDLGDLGKLSADGLDNRTSDVQVLLVLSTVGGEGVDGDGLDLGDVVPCHLALKDAESGRATTTGSSTRSSRVIWRGAIPFSELSLFRFGADGARRVVRVGQGHQIRSNGAVVGVF